MFILTQDLMPVHFKSMGKLIYLAAMRENKASSFLLIMLPLTLHVHHLFKPYTRVAFHVCCLRRSKFVFFFALLILREVKLTPFLKDAAQTRSASRRDHLVPKTVYRSVNHCCDNMSSGSVRRFLLFFLLFTDF